jgi:hypothetical protein
MCRLSWNLVTSTSWNHQGLSRPVMGLLTFFYTYGLLSILSAPQNTKRLILELLLDYELERKWKEFSASFLVASRDPRGGFADDHKSAPKVTASGPSILRLRSRNIIHAGSSHIDFNKYRFNCKCTYINIQLNSTSLIIIAATWLWLVFIFACGVSDR